MYLYTNVIEFAPFGSQENRRSHSAGIVIPPEDEVLKYVPEVEVYVSEDDAYEAKVYVSEDDVPKHDVPKHDAYEVKVTKDYVFEDEVSEIEVLRPSPKSVYRLADKVYTWSSQYTQSIPHLTTFTVV